MIVFVGQDAYPDPKQQYIDPNYPLCPDEPVAFITNFKPTGNYETSLEVLLSIWGCHPVNPYTPQAMISFFNKNKVLLMNYRRKDGSFNQQALDDLVKLNCKKIQFVLLGIKAQQLLGKISTIKKSEIYVIPHPSPINKKTEYLDSWLRGEREKFTAKNVLFANIKLK